MWRISIILNTLSLLVCCFFSTIPYSILQNRFVDYRNSDAKPLPWISQFVIESGWILLVLPVLGLVVAVGVLIYFHSRPIPRHLVVVHLSTVLLCGGTALLTFIAAGVLPFVSIIVGMTTR